RELLPVLKCKSRVIDPGVINVLRLPGAPGRDERRPITLNHHWFAEERVRSSGNRHPHSIDLQASQAGDARFDHFLVLPPYEPVRCRTVEEVVLPGALPDKMPWMLRIDPEDSSAMSVSCAKRAGEVACEASLTILHGVFVVASRGRHEPDPEVRSAVRVTEAFHVPSLATVGGLKPSLHRGVSKWIAARQSQDMRRRFDEVVGFDGRRGLRKRHCERNGHGTAGYEDGDGQRQDDH